MKNAGARHVFRIGRAGARHVFTPEAPCPAGFNQFLTLFPGRYGILSLYVKVRPDGSTMSIWRFTIKFCYE